MDDYPRKLTITSLGGNVPVQAEGSVDGEPFYFRARGDTWSMSIGGDNVIENPDWYYEEKYGEWPAAGWMPQAEALGFIDKAVEMYRCFIDGVLGDTEQ